MAFVSACALAFDSAVEAFVVASDLALFKAVVALACEPVVVSTPLVPVTLPQEIVAVESS